jgi:type IV secretion system protein VirB9
MKKFLLFFLTACCFSLMALAAQMPRYLGSEKKFRSYIFNPNDVYRYLGHYTYQGFIEFQEGETVSTISMGNPSLWLFEHLGNRLFLKPVGEDSSETNMTVITNKHVYHFELMAKEAKGITDKDLVFVAKFAYPDEKDKNIVEFPKSTPSDEPDMRDLSIYNFNYQYTGEGAIAPLKVFDNGEFTYFQFSKRNAEIPAIFTVDAGGFESLINFRSAGSYIIVERVSPQFSLRNGSDIVCVYNTNLYSNGRAKQSTLKSADGAPPQVNNFANPAAYLPPSPSAGQSFNPGGIVDPAIFRPTAPNMSSPPSPELMMTPGMMPPGMSMPEIPRSPGGV